MIWRLFFIFTAVSIFFWLNAFFVWHIYKFFGFKVDRSFLIICFTLTIAFPLSMILHSQFPNFFTTWFYYLEAIWLWVIFLWFFISFFFDISINLLHISLFVKWIIWAIIVTLICGFALYNQSWLPIIKPISIKIKNLEQPLRIWYLSDVHINWIHDITYLDSIVDMLNKENVDVVFINWDLVDWTSFEKHSFKTLDRLTSPLFVTLWNHEEYVWLDFARNLLKETKAKLLENEVTEFKWMQILGIQDLMWMRHEYNENLLKWILSNLKWDKKRPSIMLLHEPLWSELADSYWINLQLAGHTHNWQIWPFNYIVKMVFPRVLGLYKIWNLQLYVWPGTWTWWPPMRIGSQNEITIITLEKE